MMFKAFGKNPSGEELARVENSSNYREGIFHNPGNAPVMDENLSFFKILWKFLNKSKNTVPPGPLPAIKTDLKTLDPGKPVIIWFGHSSYLIHIKNRNILVDPVFSGNASPFPFFARNFTGTNIYSPDDFPAVDVLLLTHDHYDHLDYHTILKIQHRSDIICTSLGVASHLQYWGIDKNKIVEFDWWEEKQVTDEIFLAAAPAKHFSGRGFARFKTLWSSFVLKIGGFTIYIGADSGYDSHFLTIGNKYGPFDLAILESGQYYEAWKNIHMLPEEAVQASIDLQARVMMPVHWGKFSLSLHPWDEPIRRVVRKGAELNVQITTPLIGEPVILNESYPDKKWWLSV